MILGILFIFLGSVSYTLVSFIIKDSQKISTIIIGQIVSGFILSFLFLFLLGDIKIILPYWYITLPLGFLCAIEYWSLNSAYKEGGDISFLYTIKSACGVLFVAIFTSILGAFFKNYKTMDLLEYIGCFIIFIGILILPIMSIKDIKISNYINKSTILLVVSSVCDISQTLLVAILLSKLPVKIQPLNTVILIIIPLRYFGSLFLLLFSCINKLILKEKKKHESIDFKGGIILGSVLTVCIVLSYLGVYFIKYANVVSILEKLDIPISIFGGWLIYKEKLFFGKFLGALVVIAGVVLITLF